MGGGDLALQVSTKLRDIFGWFVSHFNVYLDHIGYIIFRILVLAFPSRKNIVTIFCEISLTALPSVLSVVQHQVRVLGPRPAPASRETGEVFGREPLREGDAREAEAGGAGQHRGHRHHGHPRGGEAGRARGRGQRGVPLRRLGLGLELELGEVCGGGGLRDGDHAGQHRVLGHGDHWGGAMPLAVTV